MKSAVFLECLLNLDTGVYILRHADGFSIARVCFRHPLGANHIRYLQHVPYLPRPSIKTVQFQHSKRAISKITTRREHLPRSPHDRIGRFSESAVLLHVRNKHCRTGCTSERRPSTPKLPTALQHIHLHQGHCYWWIPPDLIHLTDLAHDPQAIMVPPHPIRDRHRSRGSHFVHKEQHFPARCQRSWPNHGHRFYGRASHLRVEEPGCMVLQSQIRLLL